MNADVNGDGVVDAKDRRAAILAQGDHLAAGLPVDDSTLVALPHACYLTRMNTTTQSAARFRAIVFDMDGVLCDSEPLLREAATRMFAESISSRSVPRTSCRLSGPARPATRRRSGTVRHRMDLEEDKKRTYQIYLEIIRGRLKRCPA